MAFVPKKVLKREKGSEVMSMYTIMGPVLYGEGTVKKVGSELKRMKTSHVFIVTDGVMTQQPGFEAAIQSIKDKEIKYTIFDKVVSDPPDTLILEAVEEMKKAGADGIMAFGGGSIIDTAKAVNVMLNNPPPVSQYEMNPKKARGVKILAVPTTSGTGSEATTVAVITDSARGVKICLLESVSRAILDPELTYTVPAGLTAGNGMDVFAHSTEAIFSKGNSPFSDVMAKDAMGRVMKYLPTAVNEPSNKEARAQMMIASTFAGTAFTNSGNNIGHAVAHAVGATLHIPHGVACAQAMAAYPKFIWSRSPERIIMMAQAMGLDVADGDDPEKVADKVQKATVELMKAIKIPSLKSEYSLDQVKNDTVAEKAMGDMTMGFVPGPPVTKEEMLQLLEDTYNAY
ncbi:MAG: iron-containing alcohol dehydrogenase [Oscillospiraceae bacterium]